MIWWSVNRFFICGKRFTSRLSLTASADGSLVSKRGFFSLAGMMGFGRLADSTKFSLGIILFLTTAFGCSARLIFGKGGTTALTAKIAGELSFLPALWKRETSLCQMSGRLAVILPLFEAIFLGKDSSTFLNCYFGTSWF